MSVTIAFMTNYTLDIPNVEKQKQTIKSFYKILKPKELCPTIIFCDEKPLSQIKGEFILYNGNKCSDYKKIGKNYENKLKNIKLLQHSKLVKTTSLCDGYKKAIEMCKTPYLFFLEHDWIFLNNITHTIDDLIKCMDKYSEINCILFNKKSNKILQNQNVKETKYEIPLCLTNRQSNNPNILRIKHAKEVRTKLINSNGCSIHKGIEFYYDMKSFKIPNYCGGIECELTEYCNQNNIYKLGTYLYGKLNYSPTIIHTDGCYREKNLTKK